MGYFTSKIVNFNISLLTKITQLKADRYVFGQKWSKVNVLNPCLIHKELFCKQCFRHILICDVNLGNIEKSHSVRKNNFTPKPGFSW
jgi:hypothetical protein